MNSYRNPDYITKILGVFEKDKYQWLFLFVILFCGTLIRVSRIGNLGESDEIVSALRFALNPNTIFIYDNPNNHILNSILIYIGRSWFGLTNIAVRIFPLLAGIGLIILSYIWAKRKYGNLVSLIFATLVSFSSFLIYYSVLSRGYSYMPLALVASMLLFDLGIERPQKRYLYWGGTSLCSALAIWAQPYSVVLIIVVVVYGVVKQEFKKVFTVLFYLGFLSVLIAGVLYTPAILVTGVKESKIPFWNEKTIYDIGYSGLAEIPTMDFYEQVVSLNILHPELVLIGVHGLLNPPMMLNFDGTLGNWGMLSRAVPLRWLEMMPFHFYFGVPWESTHVCGYKSTAYGFLSPRDGETPVHSTPFGLHQVLPEASEVIKESPWPLLLGMSLSLWGLWVFLRQRLYPRLFYLLAPIGIALFMSLVVHTNPPARCYVLFFPLVYLFTAMGIKSIVITILDRVFSDSTNYRKRFLDGGIIGASFLLLMVSLILYQKETQDKIPSTLNQKNTKIMASPEWYMGQLLSGFHSTRHEFYHSVVLIHPPGEEANSFIEQTTERYRLSQTIEGKGLVAHLNTREMNSVAKSDLVEGEWYVDSRLFPTVGLASVVAESPFAPAAVTLGYLLFSVQFDTVARELVWSVQFLEFRENRESDIRFSARFFGEAISEQHSSVYSFSSPVPTGGLAASYTASTSPQGLDSIDIQPFWTEKGWKPLDRISPTPGEWLLFISHNPNPQGSGTYRARHLGVLTIHNRDQDGEIPGYEFRLIGKTDTPEAMEEGRLYPRIGECRFEYRNGFFHTEVGVGNATTWAKEL
jgi:hypothetical protein